MNKNPLVSIIIPVFNREGLIAETLNSVLAQTYKNWECLIVDDGSEDSTPNVVKEFSKRDKRFSFFSRPVDKPKGANACRNYGVVLSKGEYLLFLDSDDLLCVKALEKRLQFMSRRDCDLVISHSKAFNKYVGDMDLIWNKLNPKESNQDLLVRFLNTDMPWCTNAVLWKLSFFNTIGGWNEKLVAWQDWDIHTRALLKDAKIGVITGAADNCYRRETPNNIGSMYKTKQYYKTLQLLVVQLGNKLCSGKENNERLKEAFEKFVLVWTLQKPVNRGFVFMPLQFIFRILLINCIKKAKYLKIYIIQLLGRNYKIRRFFIKSIFTKQQELLKLKSTHNKLSVNALNEH